MTTAIRSAHGVSLHQRAGPARSLQHPQPAGWLSSPARRSMEPLLTDRLPWNDPAGSTRCFSLTTRSGRTQSNRTRSNVANSHSPILAVELAQTLRTATAPSLLLTAADRGEQRRTVLSCHWCLPLLTVRPRTLSRKLLLTAPSRCSFLLRSDHCAMVERACPGVVTQRTPRGMTAQEWRNGLKKFADAAAAKG